MQKTLLYIVPINWPNLYDSSLYKLVGPEQQKKRKWYKVFEKGPQKDSIPKKEQKLSNKKAADRGDVTFNHVMSIRPFIDPYPPKKTDVKLHYLVPFSPTKPTQIQNNFSNHHNS